MGRFHRIGDRFGFDGRLNGRFVSDGITSAALWRRFPNRDATSSFALPGANVVRAVQAFKFFGLGEAHFDRADG